MRRMAFSICAAALVVAPPALARPKDKQAPAQSPEVYQSLIDCRLIADPTARLGCFDRQVAALAEATEKRDIVIADRKEIEETRRGLFGFTAPLGRLLGFGGDDDKTPEIKRIDTTVAGVGRVEGGWRLTFQEGGVWEQTDVKNFVMSPKVGQKASIIRGAFGSFFVSVNGQPGIKMRRVE